MNFGVPKISAAEDTLLPSLTVQVPVYFKQGLEVLVSVGGEIRAMNDKLLVRLGDTFLPEGQSFKLVAHEKPSAGQAALSLCADLSREHVDYLDRLRDSTPKRDVVLKTHLRLRYLSADKANVWHLEMRDGQLAPNETGGKRYSVTGRDADGSNSVRIFVQERRGDAPLLEERVASEMKIVTVPSSEWTHEFAPKLGLGRFAVFEIPEPDAFASPGPPAGIIEASLVRVRKAQMELQKGEWTGVVEDLREVFELLRSQLPYLDDLLKRDGYDEAAVFSFGASIRAQFDLASKFQHALSKDGKTVRPVIEARREDAYLVYTTVMSILNLVARKAHRLG